MYSILVTLCESVKLQSWLSSKTAAGYHPFLPRQNIVPLQFVSFLCGEKEGNYLMKIFIDKIFEISI